MLLMCNSEKGNLSYFAQIFLTVLQFSNAICNLGAADDMGFNYSIPQAV